MRCVVWRADRLSQGRRPRPRPHPRKRVRRQGSRPRERPRRSGCRSEGAIDGYGAQRLWALPSVAYRAQRQWALPSVAHLDPACTSDRLVLLDAAHWRGYGRLTSRAREVTRRRGASSVRCCSRASSQSRRWDSSQSTLCKLRWRCCRRCSLATTATATRPALLQQIRSHLIRCRGVARRLLHRFLHRPCDREGCGQPRRERSWLDSQSTCCASRTPTPTHHCSSRLPPTDVAASAC